jgi:mannose-6-phosphate isomerase-like protein (cupin superfamily)
MICRRDDQGPHLQVPNLNQIRVLIDRSETRFTEVGLNTWRAGLLGPPHNHEAKEQIFHIISGTGLIVLGPERFSVKPGDTVYIPPAVVHQTIPGHDEPLTYVLFNAFLDDRKEGHSSFAEHVKALGETRSQQAAMGTANIDGRSDFQSSSEKALHIPGNESSALGQPGTSQTVNVLEKKQTKRSAAQIAIRPPDTTERISPDQDAEQTIYILAGSALAIAGDQSLEVSEGHVVFAPAKEGLSIKAGENGVKWLWLRTFLNSTA